MGKTFSTGLLTNGLWQDASNNIGIGGSPSGTYKLEVTGTVRGTGSAFDFYTSSGLGTSSASGLMRVITSGTSVGIAIGQSNSTRYTAIAANDYKIYNDDFFLTTNGAFPLSLGTNNTARLTIASTGAATFSSTITAAALSKIGDVYIGGRAGTYASYPDGIFGDNLHIGATGTGGGVYVNAALSRTVYINPIGGDVLIGTTSSASAYSKVTIRGTNQGLAIQDAATNNYRAIYSQSGSLYFYNGTNEGYLSTGGTWVNASDVTLKKDVKEIEYGIDEVMKLKPKWYRMIEDDLEQIGFIAQDVEEVLPELVSTSERGMKGLSYGQLTAVLTKAIQELSAQNQDLKSRLDKAGL